VNIQPETYHALSKLERIVATKEASGDISQIAATIALCGDDLTVYSGNDDQVTAIMALGGKGVISVLSHVAPRVAHDMAAAYLAGDPARSAKLQLEWFDVCKALFCDVNPIPVKEAMNLMGWDVGECRLPLTATTPAKRETLRKALANHGLV
jgi:4-hydroxy-tetrahydrodipicolinate synthase